MRECQQEEVNRIGGGFVVDNMDTTCITSRSVALALPHLLNVLLSINKQQAGTWCVSVVGVELS